MENNQSDFRQRLNTELARRCQQNPNYSLRAFAKFLEVDFSSLSKMMRGKRTLGPRITTRLGNRLGLSPGEIHKYTVSREKIEAETRSNREYLQLTDDVFQVMSDLYYHSILELLHVKHTKPDSEWISKVLGIPNSETVIALERLDRLNMITKNSDGNWVRVEKTNLTTLVEGFTSSAHRKIQSQVLDKAKMALETIPIEKRDQSAITMAVDSSRVAAAKKRIAKFRRDLADFVSDSPNIDQVYCLTVGLFPLSEVEGPDLTCSSSENREEVTENSNAMNLHAEIL